MEQFPMNWVIRRMLNSRLWNESIYSQSQMTSDEWNRLLEILHRLGADRIGKLFRFQVKIHKASVAALIGFDGRYIKM